MRDDLCVIFDLDGTLVDSEALCNQAFLDLLPQLRDTTDAMVARYRGKKLALILADLGSRIGRPLDADFEPRYRHRVSELFALELKPTVGAREMLAVLPFPVCLASSGPPHKIRQALEVSGLAAFFGRRVYSSYELNSWKPEPGLFLHAASAMGFAAERCVVVEDSEVGIRAAMAAGMRALHYLPEQVEETTSQGGRFSAMARLPLLLQEMSGT